MTRRDHGGGLDAARVRWGGDTGDWLDLSTGINPVPYPVTDIPLSDWTALPDVPARTDLELAARRHWHIPDAADVIAAPGTSALIARLPGLAPPGAVRIPGPTYNEHAAAFTAQGHDVVTGGPASTQVLVHPNNPDGRAWPLDSPPTEFDIFDESFIDVGGYPSFLDRTARPGTVVLRGIGKFWGLGGLRLGFAIGHPSTVGPLRDALGPWPVAGPALRLGTRALNDGDWADRTRARLAVDARRLDGLMERHGTLVGGTSLFRLHDVGNAAAFQARLAGHRVWSRVFPYSTRWIRLGLPPSDRWPQLEAALA